ncbi:hypothetical protein J6590_077894 [Homalodisca vitripennis]|nr:hypothetical protein J6590_077894 [Homalodisca vitripennis]
MKALTTLFIVRLCLCRSYQFTTTKWEKNNHVTLYPHYRRGTGMLKARRPTTIITAQFANRACNPALDTLDAHFRQGRASKQHELGIH